MRHSSLLDFFHMTSLNGWNFFPYRNFKPFDCIIWSVAILTSMTFCGLFITQQIQGIIISIDDTKIWNLKIWRIFFSFSDLYFKNIEYLILKWRISNCKKKTLFQNFLRPLYPMDNNDNPETNSFDIFFYFFWFTKCERNTRDIIVKWRISKFNS